MSTETVLFALAVFALIVPILSFYIGFKIAKNQYRELLARYKDLSNLSISKNSSVEKLGFLGRIG